MGRLLNQTKKLLSGEKLSGLLQTPVWKKESVDKYIVDSDIIIWFLRGREQEAKLLEKLTNTGVPRCSVVSIAEIKAGLVKNSEKILKQLKDIFTPADVSFEIAEKAGVFKQKYRLDIADMLIAATSVAMGGTLVTYNKKHFPMPEVKLYMF